MEPSQAQVTNEEITQSSGLKKTASRRGSLEQRPIMMKAAFIEKFGEPLIIKEIPVPKPASGQLLVRVEASPINPSDLGLMKGAFAGQHELPLQVGFEGAGTVIASGGGFVGRFLVGSRVAFANGKHPGTWAEYTICDTFSCIPLDKDLPVELEACAIMNPVTALALVEMIKKEKHKAIVQTAAASSLGRMLLRLLNEEKIKTISIIRKEEQRKILQEFGADVILNSEVEGFEKELKEKAEELQATCCLECVGGDFTSQIITALPPKSTCYIYGLLSEDPTSSIDFADLLAHHKTIKSFITSDWLDEQGLITKVGIVRRVQKMIKDELKTDISKLFSLEEINEAIKYYTERMGEGKVILKLGNMENKEIPKGLQEQEKSEAHTESK